MGTTHRIAEVARRSGFSTPTLRYYEEIGLLRPPARAANGYRIYEDEALERLAFITRAKQLGCSLEEIAELTTAWEGGSCGSVQERLRVMVDSKISDARRRIANLSALVIDLRRSAVQLGQHTPEGPCDDRCGCKSDPGEDSKPQDPPVACSLEGAAVPDRLSDWEGVLSQVQSRVALPGGIRLEFGADAPVELIARLVAAEADCCRFFAFALTVDERGVGLEVRAPDSAQGVVAALFGSVS